MMHFAGYVIEMAGDYLPQFFRTRKAAEELCAQNGLPTEHIVQVLRNINYAYVEPEVVPESLEIES